MNLYIQAITATVMFFVAYPAVGVTPDANKNYPILIEAVLTDINGNRLKYNGDRKLSFLSRISLHCAALLDDFDKPNNKSKIFVNRVKCDHSVEDYFKNWFSYSGIKIAVKFGCFKIWENCTFCGFFRKGYSTSLVKEYAVTVARTKDWYNISC